MRQALLYFVAGAVVGVGVGGGLALARQGRETAPMPTVRALSAVDIDEQLDGKPSRATTLEVTFPPGSAGTPHRHPGPVFGYLLEGELVFQAGDQPLRTLKAGETFYEPAMVLHAVSRNPSDTVPTRLLAVLVHPREAKELVVPEPAKAEK